MEKRRLSFKEFKALFEDALETEEELQNEYSVFLSIGEQLDRVPVPDLTDNEKASIFERAWQERPVKSPLMLGAFGRLRRRFEIATACSPARIGFFRRPAVTFVLGIVIGCMVMSHTRHRSLDMIQPVSADPLITVEHTKYTETYRGKMIDQFYPEVENPRIVVEQRDEPSPQRTLYGTLDDGEITVVWNL